MYSVTYGEWLPCSAHWQPHSSCRVLLTGSPIHPVFTSVASFCFGLDFFSCCLVLHAPGALGCTCAPWGIIAWRLYHPGLCKVTQQSSHRDMYPCANRCRIVTNVMISLLQLLKQHIIPHCGCAVAIS
jgi:hypothetical protein